MQSGCLHYERTVFGVGVEVAHKGLSIGKAWAKLHVAPEARRCGLMDVQVVDAHEQRTARIGGQWCAQQVETRIEQCRVEVVAGGVAGQRLRKLHQAERLAVAPPYLCQPLEAGAKFEAQLREASVVAHGLDTLAAARHHFIARQACGLY